MLERMTLPTLLSHDRIPVFPQVNSSKTKHCSTVRVAHDCEDKVTALAAKTSDANGVKGVGKTLLSTTCAQGIRSNEAGRSEKAGVFVENDAMRKKCLPCPTENTHDIQKNVPTVPEHHRVSRRTEFESLD